MTTSIWAQALQPAVFSWLALLLGLMIGSFLNVVIHRLPRMMEREWQAQCAQLRQETLPPAPAFNLARPRSRCPNCGHLIGAWENLPLLSWLLLRGRCKVCHIAISWRYPLVEVLTAGLFTLSAVHFGPGWAAAGAMVFCAAMIALTFIDFDTQLLPDDITLPLLWCGLLFNVWHIYTDAASAVIGAAAGYLALWSVYWGFKAITGKEGMGYGDFKLLAAIGAWLGWLHLPLVILFSAIAGATVGIILILRRGMLRDTPIPFGPYLAIAGIVSMFWGRPLMLAYLQL